MKLHQLVEAEVNAKDTKETDKDTTEQTIEELWDELEDSIAIYRDSRTFHCREINNQKWEVVEDSGSQRTPYGVFNRHTFFSKFTPVRPNQTPDVEGFTIYQLSEEYEAAEYTGDAKMVKMPEDTQERVTRGDYIMRLLDREYKYTFNVVRNGVFTEQFTKV